MVLYHEILLPNDLSHKVGKYLYENNPSDKVYNADLGDELYSSKYLLEDTDIQYYELKWKDLDPVLVWEHLTNKEPVSNKEHTCLYFAEEDLDIDL